jgi:hypothetical protein
MKGGADMLRRKNNEQNMCMWCRMLNSRADKRAGALLRADLRLKDQRC